MRLIVLATLVSLAVAGYQQFPGSTWNACVRVEQEWKAMKENKDAVCKDDSAFRQLVENCKDAVKYNEDSTQEQKDNPAKSYPILAKCD